MLCRAKTQAPTRCLHFAGDSNYFAMGYVSCVMCRVSLCHIPWPISILSLPDFRPLLQHLYYITASSSLHSLHL
jgi:hypothetical protein